MAGASSVRLYNGDVQILDGTKVRAEILAGLKPRIAKLPVNSSAL